MTAIHFHAAGVAVSQFIMAAQLSREIQKYLALMRRAADFICRDQRAEYDV